MYKITGEDIAKLRSMYDPNDPSMIANKVPAVKYVRRCTGATLEDSKCFVESGYAHPLFNSKTAKEHLIEEYMELIKVQSSVFNRLLSLLDEK